MEYKVNIVGAGFVGLTLAEVLSRQNSVTKITVIDCNEERIKELKEGKLPVSEEGMELKSEKINFTTDYSEADGEVFFLCVGTPDKGNGEQVMNYLISAVNKIMEVNRAATIILKSTTLPKNVDLLINKYIDPILTRFFTNPEFLAEGKAVQDLLNQDQLIVGTSEEDKDYAEELFKGLFEGTYKKLCIVGVLEAMVTKYFLNSYKAMKLTFINEFHDFCECNEISFDEVLKSVNDPVLGSGFDKPGIGFGGSCFPKDTHAIGTSIRFCKFIHDVNELRIKGFANRLTEFLGKGDKVLFGGKAFKNGTNDIRESVSVKVAEILSRYGIRVYFYDKLPELSDLTIDQIKSNKNKFDAVIVFNELPELNEIFEGEDKFFDTRKVN